MSAGGQPAPGRILPPARTAVLLGLLVLVGLVIRVDALRNTAPPVPEFGDARAYHLLGDNLAEGRGFIRPYEFLLEGREVPTAEYPPALPVLLAAGSKVGITGEEGQRALLAVVGALTVGLVGLLGRRLGGRDGAGYLAAALAAVHPGLWNTDISLMAEPLAAFAGAALVLLALAALDRPSLPRFAALGVATGLGAMVRSEVLLVGVVLIVTVAWRGMAGAGWAARLRPLGLALVLAVIVLVPWTVRNVSAFDGELVLLSNNSGSVARGANCDGAYRGTYRGLWVTDVAIDGAEPDPARVGCFSGFPIDADTNEAQASAILRREGMDYLTDHVDEVPKVMAARVGRTVGLYQLDQQSNFAGAEGRNPTWDRRGTRSFQLLAVLGIVGLVLAGARRASRQRWLLLVPIVVSLVVVALTYGNPRFRAVAEPSVVVLGALGAIEVMIAIETARRRRHRSA